MTAMHALLAALDGWPTSALLTAGIVYALQRLMRSRGGTIAGLVAAAPLTSAPALVWLALARGAADAATVARAGMHLNALLALALLLFLNVAPRRWLAAEPARADAPETPGAAARADAGAALCAGAITGLCLAASSQWSAAACGLLACLPWTSLCTFGCTLRLHGVARGMSFLHGYLQGLGPRLVFFATAAALPPHTGAPSAVLLGLVAGSAALLLQQAVARVAVPWLQRALPLRGPGQRLQPTDASPTFRNATP